MVTYGMVNLDAYNNNNNNVLNDLNKYYMVIRIYSVVAIILYGHIWILTSVSR